MALGAVAAAVIVNSGDSATVKSTVSAPRPVLTTSAAPSTAELTAIPRTVSPQSSAPLPADTARLVPPSAVATVPPAGSLPALGLAPGAQAMPGTQTLPGLGTLPGAAVVPPTAPMPQATVDPRTVLYTVTGSKQLLDVVTIVYTDARGYPVTEFNVALPWTKMVVLNPGVQTESVVATSLRSKLNCSVVNAWGQLVAARNNDSILATCTR